MTTEAAGWTIRTRRDVGAGFRRDEVLSLGSWPEDWSDGEPAIKVSQLGGLPGDAATASASPLIHAEFLKERDRWFIVSRGRGGPFGAAGTVQELLAPTGWGLAQSWAQALDARRPDGLLDMRHQGGLSPVEASALDCEACLSAMELNYPATVILCSPERMANAIWFVARMVPEALMRDFIWGTWIEKGVARSKTISGEWPAALRSAWPSAYRMALRSSCTIDPAGGCHLSKGLSWALGEALAGRLVANDSGATTIGDWKTELDDLAPWTIDDAEVALRKGEFDVLSRRLTPPLVSELVWRAPRECLPLLSCLAVEEYVEKYSMVAAFASNQDAKPLLVDEVVREARSGPSEASSGPSEEIRLSLLVADTSPEVIEEAASALDESRSEAEATALRFWADTLERCSTNGSRLRRSLRKMRPLDYPSLKTAFLGYEVKYVLDEIRDKPEPLKELRRALAKTPILPDQFAQLALVLQDDSLVLGETTSLSQVCDVIDRVDRGPAKWVSMVIDDKRLTGLSYTNQITLVDALLSWLSSGGHTRTRKLNATIVAFLFPKATQTSQQQPEQAKGATRRLLAWPIMPSGRQWRWLIITMVSLTLLVIVLNIVIPGGLRAPW